jgi:hypothetical protein
MISIHKVVEEILGEDYEALVAVERGYLNISRYAKTIQSEVEIRSKKDVEVGSIAIALSRIKKRFKKRQDPLTFPVEYIRSYSPLSEIVYKKTPENLDKIAKIQNKIKDSSDTDQFLLVSYGNKEVGIVAGKDSEKIILKNLKNKPDLFYKNLAATTLGLDPECLETPNVCFSLLRKLAPHKIPLIEIVSTYREFTLIHRIEDSQIILDVFSRNIKKS